MIQAIRIEFPNLSNAIRQKIRLGERKRMCTGEAESQQLRAAGVNAPLYNDMAKLKSNTFRVGQTVQQWWARWFSTAQEPKETISGKDRPEWFVANVNACAGVLTQKYAGVSVTEPWYSVH